MLASYFLRLRALAAVALCLWLGLSTAQATTVVPPRFEEMVSGTDYIVRARVKAVAPELKERPGKRPIVRTRVTLEVIESIAGNAPAEPVLYVLGGKIDGMEMRVEGVPEFAVGQEEIFFVRDNGRSFYPLYAAMHGRFPIKQDAAGREYMARSNGVQLDDVAEIATPLAEGPAAQLQQQRRSPSEALSPATFIARVRAERSTGGRVLEK